MKKQFLVFCLVWIAIVSYSQMPSNIRNITLVAKVTDTMGITNKAFIHSITDSAMYLMDADQKVYSNISRDKLFRLDPAMIRSVNIRKKDQVLKGMGIGLLAGVVAGGIIGYASYQKPSHNSYFYLDFGPGVEAAGGALAGGILGTLVGAAFSIGSKKQRVDGNMQNYRKMQQRFYRRIEKKTKVS